MKLNLRLKNDERGAAALEFALVAPILLGLLYGICQLGVLFFASSGLNTAVGDAARFATVGNPTQAQIEARLQQAQYGIDPQYRGTPSVTPGQTANGVRFFDLALTYRAPIDFIFYQTSPVTLTERRRVWVNAALPAATAPTSAGGTATPPPPVTTPPPTTGTDPTPPPTTGTTPTPTPTPDPTPTPTPDPSPGHSNGGSNNSNGGGKNNDKEHKH